MGRVLVAPPPQRLYLLGKAHEDPKTGRKVHAPALGFEDFFDMERLRGHRGMHIMSMQEFLQKEAVRGALKGGRAPPNNKTDLWGSALWSYLEGVADQKPSWSGKYLAMPASTSHLAADGMHGQSSHFDHPDVAQRLRKFAGKRSPVYYDKKLQEANKLEIELCDTGSSQESASKHQYLQKANSGSKSKDRTSLKTNWSDLTPLLKRKSLVKTQTKEIKFKK